MAHHDCATLGCPVLIRGYHHYWYMHEEWVTDCSACISVQHMWIGMEMDRFAQAMRWYTEEDP